MNNTPATGYIAVPVAAFTRFTTLADELGQAARKLAQGLNTTPPADAAPEPAADPVPDIPAMPAVPTAPAGRSTAAQTAAYREHLYEQIAATGPHGASTADLAASAGGTVLRTHSAIRGLEATGRVFRTGYGTVRWYAMKHRPAVIKAMRSRVPAHDLTVAESADATGLAEQRIRDLVDAGQLGGRRVGKAFIVHRKAVLAYIDRIGTPPIQPADTPTDTTQPAA